MLVLGGLGLWLISTVITNMGFLRSLLRRREPAPGRRYLTEEEHRENRSFQLATTPRTLAELAKHGVTPNDRLKLEYFFFTDSEDKASALARALEEMGYSRRHGQAAGDPTAWVVTGWTDPMKMDARTVSDWCARMCDLGRKNDCKFDGWGTTPNQ